MTTAKSAIMATPALTPRRGTVFQGKDEDDSPPEDDTSLSNEAETKEPSHETPEETRDDGNHTRAHSYLAAEALDAERKIMEIMRG